MRKPMLALACAVLLSLSGRAFAEDTGTYRILDYRVVLTPHSNGTVVIEYYQKWLVSGGHIPWITVGTANADFQITGSGGAVGLIRPASGGSWSGVRIDLDRDYRPGDTFEVSFSIVQRRLFYADGERYKLDFTPGWYDRAFTDTLRIGVVFFARIGTVAAGPPPTFISGDEMVWIKRGLGEGERFSITIAIPVEQFPAGIDRGTLGRAAARGNSAPGIILVLVIFALLLCFVWMAMRSARRGYSGGRMYYGGFWGSGAGGRGRSTGGGGGFGGSSISCACACVACACACACAGGGGAGCSRKLEHTCPACGRPAAV